MNTPRLFTRTGGLSLCLSCRRSFMRQFSSTHAPFAASFQSYPLNPHPQQLPRNTAAPDTSITRSMQSPSPKVHETRPLRETPGQATLVYPSSPKPSVPKPSVSEEEAQTSKPEFAAAAPTTTTTTPPPPAPSASTSAAAKPATATPAKAGAPAPRPRAKLRTPRKAAIKLTPAAVGQMKSLLDQPNPRLIKVGVRNRGCSGLSYTLDFVEKAGAFDEAVEQDGVKVLIDSKALFSVIGSEMDYVEDKLSQRFVFRNPNIKEECGCGESFMV